MNASENASYRNACLLHEELISGHPTLELDSGPLPASPFCKERHSSGDSFDSAFESEESFQKRVIFAKVRSFSECAEPSPPVHRGILKRFSKSRTRSYSESSAEVFSFENGLVQGVGSCQQISFEEEDDQSREQDSDENDSDKVKKTVRFSETVHKQLFRSNSSILGQRKKNQRKQRNKKRREEEKLSSSTESMDQITDSIEQLIMDSGTEVDVDSESGNETAPPRAEPVATKKNKKQKKGRNRRKSTEADLMFDLDL